MVEDSVDVFAADAGTGMTILMTLIGGPLAILLTRQDAVDAGFKCENKPIPQGAQEEAARRLETCIKECRVLRAVKCATYY